MKAARLIKARFGITEVSFSDTNSTESGLCKFSNQVESWMVSADINQDGVLSYDEFKQSLDGVVDLWDQLSQIHTLIGKYIATSFLYQSVFCCQSINIHFDRMSKSVCICKIQMENIATQSSLGKLIQDRQLVSWSVGRLVSTSFKECKCFKSLCNEYVTGYYTNIFMYIMQ